MYKRTGSLFEHPFRRKRVETEDYFKELVLYIHNNPVKHGHCRKPIDYHWSRYRDYILDHNLYDKNKILIDLFDNFENFKFINDSYKNNDNIEDD